MKAAMKSGPLPFLAAACSVLGAAAGAGASPVDDRVAELEDRIHRLTDEVQQLRADGNGHAESRAEAVRGLIHDVLADADARASLLQDAANAGHDGSFYLRSTDGNYRMNIAGRIQGRYLYNRLDNAEGRDGNRTGFEVRRTRLDFSGNVFSPDWSYKIQGDFSRSGGGFRLLDAQIGYRFNDNLSIRAGQFRQPFLREDSMSSGRQLAVERSLVNAAFGQGRTQGVELSTSTDQFRLSGTFSEGFGGNNTAALDRTTEFAFTGRAEWLVDGTWGQFRDFSGWVDDGFGLLIGAAAHYQADEYGQPGIDKEKTVRWTVDASAEFGGANVFAALVGNHLDEAGLDQFGVVVQGGFFIVPDEWELFARYAWGDDDMAATDDLSVATVGVNRFFNGHNLKWTTDVGYGFNEVASTWSSGGAGWRTDDPGEDGQLVLRTQFQLAF